ncbi:aminotransferase class I/II-fold pyridoxal phosphate-dependent enzyme [Arenibacter aquaticus]|uniref:Aminotransferase class I/II-fold pyridoxal phosphate-dependent enzyme n=1 Tax=Arenibacter aquaticus TaxID=2489054 RepID=A0A3S0AG44_9FLAO|nr:methionine aminotransferase [Arenibacter aquaticus]RTE54922.1 aminotransferase class I/II-fold pyridoxal phosphate-dependent enzyme [Arenibacter aquaticus]
MPHYKDQIPSKLPEVKTTIFTRMGQLAHQYNALNLSQGFPNFDPDPKLIKLVTKAMNAGYNQYAPMAGVLELREVIAQKIDTLYGQQYQPDSEITITIGATQAIFTIITAFIGHGDEVIVFKPAYDCYEPAIEVNGGIPILIQMNNKDFKVDWADFRSRLTNRTKMVIINSPHNPSGTIFSDQDMLQLQQSLTKTNIIVISDEVYEHIIFDGNAHHSASKYPDLASRTFVCGSFGKTFHITGWKMGYCAGPAELMHEFRKVHQYNVFSADHAVQRALANYLKEPQHYLGLNQFYQEKRDLFQSGLSHSRLKIRPCMGTYFQLLDYSEITQEQDEAYAERLVREKRIACIPISSFNTNGLDNHLLRFCFAKTNDTLKSASDILCSL